MKWLDRRIAAPGPYLTLCLTDKDFRKALKHCNVKEHLAFTKTTHAHATTHCLERNGAITCIVTMRRYEGRDPIEVAGLLVHEAVHVWQEYCLLIGEDNPAKEQEAYAIQAIAQELMAEFVRLTKGLK